MKSEKVIVLACFFIVSSLTHNAFGQPNMPPAAVKVAKVEERKVSPVAWLPGTIASRHDSLIAAEVTGALLRVAEVGDTIQKGESIAQVDDKLLQLQLKDDQAEILRLQANLKYIDRQVARMNQLITKNNTSRSELDETIMRRDMLQQELVAAKNQKERTEYNIERAQLLAPFDGVVVSRLRQPGEHIRAGESLVRLVNVSDLEVSARAPIQIVAHLSVGSQVEVKNSSRSSRAKIRSVVPVGEGSSRMVEVRLNLSAEQWVVGEAVKVALPSGPTVPSKTIPRDALVLRNELVYVYRISNDNKAERVVVKPGGGKGAFIAVSGDLQVGNDVVVRGAERLRPGQLVNVISETTEKTNIVMQ